MKIDVSVYYFPNYHKDSRNEQMHGEDWTEWELVKAATPRFDGHNQPKIPLWGYEDESDPKVMAKKIEAASSHAVTNFIFDWYWYNDGPYLQKCLENGFMKAENNHKLKFSLMWANHDWIDIHPAQRSLWKNGVNTLMQGEVTPETFVKATDHMINNYFCHPSYYKIDGACYVSIYMIAGLVAGFKTVKEARKGLDDFRERALAKGQKLHLNAVVWGQQILPGEKQALDINDLMRDLNFDSITSYVWIHHNIIPTFPNYDYSSFAVECEKMWKKFEDEYELPYFPNMTMGWDSSPRTIMSDKYDYLGYPFTPILTENTPEEFEKSLKHCKEYLENSPLKHKMLTLNSWNEWTEGSYIEPDEENQFGYLEAIKKVFK